MDRQIVTGNVTTRRALVRTIGIGAVLPLLAACGGADEPTDAGEEAAAADVSARFAGFEPADEPNGDLAKVIWPGWLDQFDPEVKRLYAFQVENGDLMRWMPCFCGCKGEDGHRNNRDCYVEAVNPDGSVVFDSMAPT